MNFLQGNTYLLAVKFFDEDGTEEIDGSRITKAEFVFNDLQFLYVADETGRVTYDSENNVFLVGLKESETLGFKGIVKWQAKALLDDGSVSGTLQASDYLYDTLCKTILDENERIGTLNSRILSASLTNLISGGGTDDYPDLNNKPQINGVELLGNKTGSELGLANVGDLPTKTSELTNDSGFITAQDIPNIPTKTSDLTNDSGFITNTVNNLTNYYLKSETYTQAEVNALVATIKTIKVEIVQTLPTASAETYFNDSKTIYMVRNTSTSGNNYYDEYITIRSGSEGSYTYSWENIGSTQIDVSNKLDKDTTTTNTLYGKGSTADTQMMWRIDQTGNVGHAIPQRNSYGGLNVPTPTTDGEAANKKYVDDNDTIKSISAGGTALTPDANKNVDIPFGLIRLDE